MSDVMGDLMQRRNAIESAKGAVVTYVRGLEPVLRDHGAHNSADRLMAMLAEVDAAEREMSAFVAENGAGVLAALNAIVDSRGPR